MTRLTTHHRSTGQHVSTPTHNLRRTGPRTALIPAAVLAFTLGSGSFAWSQERDFSAERFLLASDRNGILGVNTGTVIGHLNWDLGLWMGLANDPLSIYQRTEDGDFMHEEPLLNRRVGGSVVGVLGLTDHFQLGVHVPLVINQAYQDTSQEYAPDAGYGLGDIRLVPKLQLLRSDRHGVDVAIMPILSLPTGRSGSYVGESSVTFAPELAVSRWLGAFRLAGNIGYLGRTGNQTTGLMVEDDLFFRFGAGYRFGGANRPVAERPLELDATVSLASRASDFLGKFNTNHAELILGGSYQVTPKWKLVAGTGAGLRAGHGTPDWRVLASARYTHTRKPRAPVQTCATAPPADDLDCDDVPNTTLAEPPGPEQDYCPDTPGTRRYHGCPEPSVAIAPCASIELTPGIAFVADGSDSGVHIAYPSRVPLEALAAELQARGQRDNARVIIDMVGPDQELAAKRGELIKSFLIEHGAKAVNLTVASTQVADASDYQTAFSMVCPEVAFGACTDDGWAPISLSPAIAFDEGSDDLAELSALPLDRLARDLLEENSTRRVTVEVAGPDVQLAELRARTVLEYLRDKGVKEVFLADVGKDASSNAASTAPYAVVFKQHCQQPKLLEPLCQKLDLKRKIQFDVNSDIIKLASLGVLKRDALWILQDFPDLEITVEGHTSSEGKRKHNLDLSLRRARSVVNYLASQGVDAGRLKAVGYGPDQPLVDREITEADRQKNRRIEFRVTYAKDCPCEQLKVDRIQFHFNSAKIKKESYPVLRDVSRSLNARPEVNLRIEGHTSSEGSTRSNLKLSRKRARAIMSFLRIEGIAKKRLRSKGMGESQLLVDPDDTEDKREQNRRVEFHITKGQRCEAK